MDSLIFVPPNIHFKAKTSFLRTGNIVNWGTRAMLKYIPAMQDN